MKTITTIRLTMLTLLIALSIFSCKKDDGKNAPTPAQTVTFDDLKKLSTDTSVKVSGNLKISGIVISDAGNKNIDSKTVVMQEGTDKPGIIVNFDAAQSFATGDRLEVTISGQTLAKVNGEIVLQNIPVANAKKTDTATITAKATTIADINANKAAWDGTLVSIAATEVSNSTSTFKGTLTVKDASGTLSSNILAGASFENTALPPSVSMLTGIVRVNGNEVRIDIRKPSDILAGAITRIVTEDFTNVTAVTPNYSDPKAFYEFSTALGLWTGQNDVRAYGFLGSEYDADFTTADRTYVYLIQARFPPDRDYDLSNYIVGGPTTSIEGVKTVTLTFAGSKATHMHFEAFGGSLDDFAAFDPAVDYFQVAIIPTLIYQNKNGDNVYFYNDSNFSPEFKKVGEFLSFTYTVPTRDELIAANVTAEQADAWLANPSFQIHNLSIRHGDGYIAPILLDKVVYGFGN